MNLYHNATGFSHFSLGKHEEALSEYQKVYVKEDDEEFLPCLYNIKLC
jgi:hypothetical protein